MGVGSCCGTRLRSIEMNLREQPLPSTWTVAEGLEAYLAENGFTIESYDAKTTKATILGITFSVPNTKRHRWAIMLHDLHHVATGFGTDLRGEAEISLWEWRKGIRALGLYVGSIVVSISLLGPLLAPKRSRRAWRAGKGGSSLFGRPDLDYADMLTWTIAELRETLGLPQDGIAEGGRRLHGGAPKGEAKT